MELPAPASAAERRALPPAAQALAAWLGRLVGGFGRYCLLVGRAFSFPRDLRGRLYARDLATHMVRFGVDSIPIVALAAAFTGGVSTVQAIYQLENPLLPPTIVGTFVQQAMVLELGSLVTAFVLCGRVGARIAAELGTMRVKEQIDALEAMGLSSLSYLVAPRIAAGALMFPVLYILAAAVGLGASAYVAHLSPVLTAEQFWTGARLFFRPYDIFFGLVKSVVFGFVITSIACYTGYHARGGAEGVGTATTRATVLACVYVLLADYVCAALLL
ncbi:MAG: MlaE family ABC transporter permease [Rubricoccaceae bacterium]